MNNYLCELWDGKVRKESFYRKGESAKEVLAGLKMFDFGKGEWTVVEQFDFDD